LRIGIAFDLAPEARPSEGPDDLFEEFDKPETVEALAAVLRGEGHAVVFLGDGRDFVTKVLADPPDLVWNMAEGEGTGRCREARVPALLEMLGVPFTGSDPLTLAAGLDKPVAKALVAGVVAVPKGMAVAPGASVANVVARVSAGECGPGPWIVKPAFEGSSKGIRARCLVRSPDEAGDLWRELARDYQQPILVEEFIEGDEVTVGLVGNGASLDVFGVTRIIPTGDDASFVYSLEVKRDYLRRVRYETPARLPEGVIGRVERAARRVYEALGCRDLGRIDFRVRDGVPYFLEANPLPGLAPVSSDLVIMAEGLGVGHAGLIRRILKASMARLGLPG